MKKIVIPTDLTPQSLNLIKYGLQVMKGQTCEIILLHFIPLPDSITDLMMLPRVEETLALPNTPFHKALERMRKLYAVEISHLELIPLYGGNPLKIRNFIDDYNIDLILCPVMEVNTSDTHNPEPFSSLVKDVSCPVLYIPHETESIRFRKIVYLLDTDDKYSLLLNDLLLNLTAGRDHYVTFLIIFKPDTTREKLKYVLDKIYHTEQLKGLNCSVHLLREKNFTGGVYTFVEEFKVDLLVTGRKKNLLGNLFTRKRTSSDMAKHTKVPFLSIS
ncbi:universal stress protein [Adhaeribacter pallidiroseus]|uniref:UspA domain-containing protein n=1 Tax=Adhaeribacter pallidiroseus TaxID=2072847 RepID=A0A369QC34_9BACT|nr:universal stress protein [Adhaeribacter pallidiroseus]RDC62264.1 hypothetical protein AHMF7616_00855 [Adhaeribacter pallidiroseus]